MEIRTEQSADEPDIFRLHQNAFQRDDESLLVEKLRLNPQFDRQLSFVALIDEKLVAHLLFTSLQIQYPQSFRSISSLALAPISVAPEHQRKGIGTKLIDFALNRLKSNEISSTIIVLGHEHFYPRFGFRPARHFRIRPPFKLDNEDCFMLLELKMQSLPVDEGDAIVKYLPEFGIENFSS